MKYSVAALAAFIATVCVAENVTAFSIDFENGQEGQRASNFSGITFENFNGFAPVYLDCRAGYNCTSSNGYGNGSYYVAGDFAIWAGPEATAEGVKVDFANNDGTWFKTGYSSSSVFFLDAYLTDGTLVRQSGAGNLNTDSLGYLTVDLSLTGQKIDYVVIHDSGNYWLADNISGDSSGVATVPLPAAVWLFAPSLLGLVGLGYRRKSA